MPETVTMQKMSHLPQQFVWIVWDRAVCCHMSCCWRWDHSCCCKKQEQSANPLFFSNAWNFTRATDLEDQENKWGPQHQNCLSLLRTKTANVNLKIRMRLPTQKMRNFYFWFVCFSSKGHLVHLCTTKQRKKGCGTHFWFIHSVTMFVFGNLPNLRWHLNVLWCDTLARFFECRRFPSWTSEAVLLRRVSPSNYLSPGLPLFFEFCDIFLSKPFDKKRFYTLYNLWIFRKFVKAVCVAWRRPGI